MQGIETMGPAVLQTLMDLAKSTGRIEERLETGDRFHQEIRNDLREFRSDIGEVKTRLAAVEQQRSSISDRLLSLRDFLAAIAPVKDWLIGALIVALALKGITAPGDAKAVLLEALKAL